MKKNSTQPFGLGRRKTAIAQVQLTDKPGEQKVNDLELTEYFPSIALQNIATASLTLTSQAEKYGLAVRVKGGGKQAQADAVRLGVARALVSIDEDWRKQLSDAGFLRRDPRSKERKKFGLKGARRAPQFSKR